ncbi:hypothetical protein BJ997_001048 [Cryobacterium roopkundense]|uniref:Uncharacterized protein n=1 Tax=Cryobacterium roopkundense TaxID=1001240 RepID=A0A7W8ZUY8_9MICO|nr:hypothetical protein [Cryobacterium roopkundense]
MFCEPTLSRGINFLLKGPANPGVKALPTSPIRLHSDLRGSARQLTSCAPVFRALLISSTLVGPSDICTLCHEWAASQAGSHCRRRRRKQSHRSLHLASDRWQRHFDRAVEGLPACSATAGPHLNLPRSPLVPASGLDGCPWLHQRRTCTELAIALRRPLLLDRLTVTGYHELLLRRARVASAAGWPTTGWLNRVARPAAIHGLRALTTATRRAPLRDRIRLAPFIRHVCSYFLLLWVWSAGRLSTPHGSRR